MSGKKSKKNSTGITSVAAVAKSSSPKSKDTTDPGIVAEMHQMEMYSGPIPHPDILRKYDDVVPGAADRIINLVEREASHRHECDNLRIKTERRDSLLGIIFAAFLCIVSIVAGVLIALKVSGTAGTVVGGFLGASGLASVFGAMIRTTRTSWQIFKDGDDND